MKAKRTFLPVFLSLFSFFTYSQNSSWIENVTVKTGLDSIPASYVYVCDINMDDYPDIILVQASTIKGKIVVLLNQQKEGSSNPGERVFKDMTSWTMLDRKRSGKPGRVIDNVVFGDVDNDGDPDCITGIYYHRWEYYHPDSLDPGDRCEVMLNKGNGQFVLLENSGLNTIGPHQTGKDRGLVNITGITMLDYDKDGKIDLFLSSWFDDYKNNVMTPSYLLKGNGDGTFSDVSNTSGIGTDAFPLYGANATDWNNDGWMDIATSPYCRSGGSLWRNNANGTFTDVASSAGYNTQLMKGDNGQELCTWASQPQDYDNDGDIDFFYLLVHGGIDANEGRSVLVINNGRDTGYKLSWALEKVERKPPRSSHLADYDGAWLDLDNDMWTDMVLGNGGYDVSNQRLYILRQDPASNNLNDISGLLGITGLNTMIRHVYSLQPVDFDLDGDDDILVLHGDAATNPKPRIDLIENKIGDQQNWIGIKLDRPPLGCNGSAVGSRIYVYSGGVTQMREIKAGYGHFGGQQPFITNFGLGNNSIVDSVVIYWQTNPVTYTRVDHPPLNQISIIDKNGLWGSLTTTDNLHDNTFSLFPNPVNGTLNIKSDYFMKGDCQWEIIDLSGKILCKGIQRDSGMSTLSISTLDLPNGYYLIKLLAPMFEPVTKAFMIMH